MTSPGHRCVPMNSMRSVWNIVGSYAAHSAVRVCRSPLDSRSCDYLRILNRCNRSAHWEPIRESLPEQEFSTDSTESSTPPVIRWIGIAAACLIVFVLAMVAYVHERSV